ncbi:MAG: Transmembrane exosortase (Exosortase_EpsH) [Syntrophorhabdaceae bacterium PtaU1.Bin034]|nr:MAG: Transmembrane exosortase (Exosortase_EpsH) [Syntrophorhabdaceae bacterium PtaU1.Bin034]
MIDLTSRSTLRPWVIVGALLVLFCAAYWVPLKAMVNIWWTNEDYSYGFLIPFGSAYLAWERRRTLDEVTLRTDWRFFAPLAFFVLLSLYGILGSSGNISMPAVPVILFLLVGFCCGRDVLKRLAFPIAFLVFMVPVPGIIERSLGIFLKSISTRLGGALIDAMGVPVFVTGNIIDLGVTQLQVVDACSGMRYLSVLLALGVMYSYLFEHALWKRLFCAVATIPIAMMVNGLRIGATGVLAQEYGPQVAEGFFHGFSAWVMFIIAFAFLFIIGKLLRYLPPREEHTRVPAPQPPGGQRHTAKPRGGSVPKGFVVSVLILAVVGLSSFSTASFPPIKIRGGIERFPLAFGGWEGRPEAIDPEMITASGAEEAFSAVYKKNRSDVSLYMGYRSSAFLANENFFHSPTVCLPSSGWTPTATTKRVVTGVPLFRELPVTAMVIQQSGVKYLVYFWFQTKDRATSDKNMNRFHLTLHAIARDNSHDLFVRPIMAISADETTEQAEARMDSFVRDLMPVLLDFLEERQYEER